MGYALWASPRPKGILDHKCSHGMRMITRFTSGFKQHAAWNYHASHEEICPKFIQILAGRAPKKTSVDQFFHLSRRPRHKWNALWKQDVRSCSLHTIYTAENERTRKLQNDKPLSSTTIRLRAAMVLRPWKLLAQAFDFIRISAGGFTFTSDRMVSEDQANVFVSSMIESCKLQTWSFSTCSHWIRDLKEKQDFAIFCSPFAHV